MIVVRDIFRVKFGMAAQFKVVMLEGQHYFDSMPGVLNRRMLSDLVADFYTFVLETSFENLTALEAAYSSGMADEGWHDWYHNKVVPLVDSGRREIFNVIG
jgi:hypothetical protein